MSDRKFLRRRAPGAAALAVATFALVACQTSTGTAIDKKTTQGAVLGTLAGAAAGAAIDDRKRARGALIGAAVGGVSGGLIGRYLDKQAQEIDAIPDANVERRGDELHVLFPGDLLYASGSANLQPGGQQRINTLADTLTRYPDTNVLIKGHTDSVGSEQLNKELSQRRAENVRDQLVARGVAGYRITTVGLGEAEPVADNSTSAGRQLNRRVEIVLQPNQSLRDRAASGGSGAAGY